ncbi:MAG: HAD family hydrolase, partial [Lysobacter sp.]
LHAEGVLDRWLREHAPRTAERYPVEAIRALRDEIAVQRPDLAHDYTTQRRLTLEHMLRETGEDIALAVPAFDVFFAARCEVVHYADSEAALARLAARVPLAALSNGNADLQKIGLMPLFRFQLGAREHGRAKPDPSIFHAACARLELEPAQVLHVGDDIELDIVGGAGAGLRTCWINRENRTWPPHHPRPDLEFTTLAELADWLDAAHRTDTAAA